MIIFKKIRYKNFLSTGNQFTEINFQKNNTNLIVGSNGAGKSTVLDALTFALFNKAFRKVNKNQLINTINEKECLVEILSEGLSQSDNQVARSKRISEGKDGQCQKISSGVCCQRIIR